MITKEFRNQIKGCFNYCDTIEEIKRTIQNVCRVQIINIKEDVINNEPCFIVEYKKPEKKLTVFKSDSIKVRVEKELTNMLKGAGIIIVKKHELINK